MKQVHEQPNKGILPEAETVTQPIVKIVGFNGSMGYLVGLATAIAQASSSKMLQICEPIMPSVKQWIRPDTEYCFKLGTRLPDPIGLALFKSYAEEGRLTKLPETSEVTYNPGDPPVVALVAEELIDALRDTALGPNSDGYMSDGLSWEDCKLNTYEREKNEWDSERKIQKFTVDGMPRWVGWAWVGSRSAERGRLRQWHEAFRDRFDSLAKRDNPNSATRQLNELEKLGWYMLGPAPDRQTRQDSYLRLGYVYWLQVGKDNTAMESQYDKKLRLRNEGIPWEIFRENLAQYIKYIEGIKQA